MDSEASGAACFAHRGRSPFDRETEHEGVARPLARCKGLSVPVTQRARDSARPRPSAPVAQGARDSACRSAPRRPWRDEPRRSGDDRTAARAVTHRDAPGRPTGTTGTTGHCRSRAPMLTWHS